MRFFDRTLTLSIRTDLHVLHEIGVDPAYPLADDLRPDVIVDLGAHIGIATMYFVAAHPDARVIAVEPDSALVVGLRDHVKGEPVTVVHAAIAGSRDPVEFYDLRSRG